MKPKGRLFISVVTAVLSAMMGLLVEIFGGVIAWTVFRGMEGILFAAIIGGFTALIIRRSFNLPATSVAGAFGALIAAFATISCMEVYKPGSLEWAVKGGLYGAAWGVPFAAILGPLALLSRDREAKKRRLNIMGLPLIGLLIVITGIIYGAVFAGIPYQDPTPEMQASWNFHNGVAKLMFRTGCITLIIGFLAAPFILIKEKIAANHKLRKTTPTSDCSLCCEMSKRR